MTRPREGAKSRRAELLEIERQTGIRAKELRAPPKPPAFGMHIWEWFSALSRARSFLINGDGSILELPLSWADITGYFTLHRISPLSTELAVLAMLDDAYLQSRYETEKKVMTNSLGMRSA